MKVKNMRLTIVPVLLLSLCLNVHVIGQNSPSDTKTSLPGATSHPAGTVLFKPYKLDKGPECQKGLISVPENRQSETSRNIRLYFYQIKSRQPSELPPVFFLPGGPGGFYNDNWVNGLAKPPNKSGSNAEALRYLNNRDVVLVNQRGASLPDRSFQLVRFHGRGGSLRKPKSLESVSDSYAESTKLAVENWQAQGMDLAGYDIMNMVEDINDLRKKLGYEKIILRGTSFGSQWSMAYMKKYPDHVDRAILGGVEPLDHGYDSPQGIWNVFKRLEAQMDATNKDNELAIPDIKLTDALKAVVQRLETKPVVAEGRRPGSKSKRKVPIGVEDFRGYLRSGINARRETRKSLEALPKYVFEIYNQDYQFLAFRVIADRADPIGGNLQFLLIDNSLGISKTRDAKLISEPGSRWLGELNLTYKATRDHTPTPVISDSFRNLKTSIPILMVQGDMDLSTPIENAEELLPSLPNGHLVRIHGGTHGAFGEISRHDNTFMEQVEMFLNANLDSKESIKEVYGKIPTSYSLPPLEFESLTGPSLFDELDKKK